ncbi:MAG: hypothetical protein ABI837_09130 [Acidobacteriota bacterium]
MKVRAFLLSIVAMLEVLSLQAQAPAVEATVKAARFNAGGFANVTFENISRNGRSVLESGEVDLFASFRLSDRWSVLSEAFTYRAGRSDDVDVRPSRSLELDLARLYLAYHPSDRLRLELGQNHTGIIQWNEREHRSRFLQTPIDVPAIAVREEQGGAWPLHFVGAWASGRLPGSLGIQYGAGVGEARGSARDELQPALDPESSLGQLFSLSVSPDKFPGLQVGAAEYSGDIPAPEPEGAMREVDQTLFASYVSGGLETRGEWAQMHHTRFSDRRHFVTTGWYALISYRLRGRWQPIRPYLLLDNLDVPVAEHYLSEVADQRAWAAGVRWDASRHLAVKSDFRSQLAHDGSRERLIRLQIAVSF